MKWEKFIDRFSLSQRDFPQGVGRGKSLKIKNHILRSRNLASENTWDVAESVLEEIIKAIELEWQRMRRKWVRQKDNEQ
jgi:hypothetical protein